MVESHQRRRRGCVRALLLSLLSSSVCPLQPPLISISWSPPFPKRETQHDRRGNFIVDSPPSPVLSTVAVWTVAFCWGCTGVVCHSETFLHAAAMGKENTARRLGKCPQSGGVTRCMLLRRGSRLLLNQSRTWSDHDAFISSTACWASPVSPADLHKQKGF